jgi:hypothetical protein
MLLSEWREFPSVPCLTEKKKKLDDSLRLDVDEITRAPDMLPSLFPSWSDRWRTLVSAVMNFRVPENSGNFLTSCKPVSFSRRTLHHGVSK